jgi:hypothetical protein
MTRIRLLIRIISITIVTVFLMVCIIVGAFILMYYFDLEHYVPNAVSDNFYLLCFIFYDYGQDLYAAARYYCWPYPASDNWIECLKVKYVQRYLRHEKVKEIDFGMVENEHNVNSLQKFGRGIIEPEKIKRMLQLISTAKKDMNMASIWLERMIIITDKHKFVIPIGGGDRATYGWDWTSQELSKQFWQWRENHEVYKYELPSKEEVVAVILYSLRKPPRYAYYLIKSPPLVLFGDKKLTEKLIFEKFGKLSDFGVGYRKEASEYIYDKELKPEWIYEGNEWLEKIMNAYEDAFKEADKREKYFPMELDKPIGNIVFIIMEKEYRKEIGIDASTVYDDYIKSERLKKYFDELGLTKELLAASKPIKAPQEGIFYIICISVAIEAIVLFVVSSILRKLKMFISWKILTYYAIIVIGSLTTNFLLYPVMYTNLSSFVLVVFLLLVFSNVVLSKRIFAINYWKACPIGAVLGLINTLMIIIATPHRFQ